MSGNEIRDGVTLTNLDQPLFEGANATKRELVDYVDAVADRLLGVLSDRPLSVIRVVRGGPPFRAPNWTEVEQMSAGGGHMVHLSGRHAKLRREGHRKP